MNPEYHIEVQENHIIPLVKKAYELSSPVGMGFYQPYHEELSDEYIKKVQEDIDKGHYNIVVMDYVNGRQCKFNIYRDATTGKFYMMNKWYDHTENQFKELLKIVEENK